jgi:hypothetical protein
MKTPQIQKGIAICLVLLFIGLTAASTQASNQPPQQPIQSKPTGVLGFHIVVDGEQGAHGWYISYPITIRLVFDNGTIPMSIFYSIDGGTPIPYTPPIILIGSDDGEHEFTFLVIDQYGTQFTDNVTIKVDTVPPHVTLSAHTRFFLTSVSGTAWDNTSGVWYVDYDINGLIQGNLTYPPYTWDWKEVGKITLTVKAVDMAGLSTTETAPYLPPSHFPHLHNLLSWLLPHLRP